MAASISKGKNTSGVRKVLDFQMFVLAKQKLNPCLVRAAAHGGPATASRLDGPGELLRDITLGQSRPRQLTLMVLQERKPASD